MLLQGCKNSLVITYFFVLGYVLSITNRLLVSLIIFVCRIFALPEKKHFDKTA